MGLICDKGQSLIILGWLPPKPPLKWIQLTCTAMSLSGSVSNSDKLLRTGLTYKSKIARAEKYLDEEPWDFIQTKTISCQHGESCKESQIKNEDDRQKLAKCSGLLYISEAVRSKDILTISLRTGKRLPKYGFRDATEQILSSVSQYR